jgi:hypothetical protein
MQAIYFKQSQKQLRAYLALGLLLLSLIGTHWIGFSHSITHSGVSLQSIETACTDHAPSLEHETASCHLLDALTLAGFIASDSNTFLNSVGQPDYLSANIYSAPARIHPELYHSRAPPTLIL